ncbi:hypothetical protein ACA910_014618 [Epithemia clementina (nom. ined.)]
MARGMFGRFRGSRRTPAPENATTPEGAPPVNVKGRGSHTSNKKAKSSNSLTSPARSAATDSSTTSNHAKRISTTNQRASATSTHRTDQSIGHQQRHARRNSFGDASISTTASVSDASTGNGAQKPRSSRYNNSQRNRRPRSQEILEEEKKEIPSEAEEELEDEFFQSAEFRSRVAHEAADLDKEGNTFFERGDYDQAFMSYERALKLKRASLQVDKKHGAYDMLTETESQKASILASVATSINNMTYLRQRAGQATADETMAAYLKSLQIKREILGPNHLSVGKTLNNIGSVFYLKKEYIPALKAYENAYEIMSEQLGETHLDVGTVLSNIGDVHTAMLDKPKALDYYKRALDIRWAQLGRNDPKVIRLMEQTASLETGKQPLRKEADSDSEDEEFVEEDRERHRVFQEECHALQEELVEDIRFFDLVERTLAIELVQQKTKFMRAVRAMRKSQESEGMQIESSHGNLSAEFDLDDHSDDDSLSVMSAPPDLDLEGRSMDEAPEVLAFLHEIGADRSPIRTSKHTRKATRERPDTPTNTKKPPEPITPPTVSTRATNASPQDKSIDQSIDDHPSPANSSVSRSQRHFPVHPRHRPRSTTALLTPEERRLALITVQERVATLKSKRELEMEKEGLDPKEARKQDLIQSRRQMYIDATMRSHRIPKEASQH